MTYPNVQLHVNGEWRAARSGKTINVLNPANEEVIGTVAHAEKADLDEALAAAEKGHALRPSDLFINTTLSRIWMERGDKPKAEHHGAQARLLGWGDQLKQPEGGLPGEIA